MVPDDGGPYDLHFFGLKVGQVDVLWIESTSGYCRLWLRRGVLLTKSKSTKKRSKQGEYFFLPNPNPKKAKKKSIFLAKFKSTKKKQRRRLFFFKIPKKQRRRVFFWLSPNPKKRQRRRVFF